jgi:hypothetical protein
MQNNGYFPKHWDEVTCISYLQRKILLLSIAYYEYDASPMSDYDYDYFSQLLAKMMRECKDVADSEYYYAFYDFTGSTGYHLYSRLTKHDKDYLTQLSESALKEIDKKYKNI